MASALLAASKYGEEVSRLQLALQLADKGTLDATPLGGSVAEDLLSLQRVLKRSLARAEKDNDLIYLDPVPQPQTLIPIKPASMVKPIIFAILSEPRQAFLTDSSLGGALFGDLLPFTTSQAARLYRARRNAYVDTQLLRQWKAVGNGLKQVVAKLGLPGKLQAAERQNSVPASLLHSGERIYSAGGLNVIFETQSDIAALRSNCKKALEESSFSLRKRRGLDSAFASSPQHKELSDRESQYQNLFKQAENGDEEVARKLGEWEPTIRALLGGSDGIIKLLPKDRFIPVKQEQSLTKSMEPIHNILNDIDQLQMTISRGIDGLKALANVDIAGRRSANIILLLTYIEEQFHEESRRFEKSTQGELWVARFEPLIERRLRDMYSRYETIIKDDNDRASQLAQILTNATAQFDRQLDSATVPTDRADELQKFNVGGQMYDEMRDNLDEGKSFYLQLLDLILALQSDSKKKFTTREPTPKVAREEKALLTFKNPSPKLGVWKPGLFHLLCRLLY